MSQKIRRRFAWLIVLLLLLLFVFYLNMWIVPLVKNPLAGVPPSVDQWFLYYVGALVVLALAFMALMFRRRQTTTAHGSAHFATREDLGSYGTLVASPRKERKVTRKALATAGQPPASKMHLGCSHRKLIVLDEQMQESHVFALAPSGAGKTSRVIAPALLREYGSRSLFINDTKGELVEMTIGHLSQSHRCLVFAPTNPQISHRYNPLAHVHSMDDAEALADCLIDNTGTSREAFWNSAPKLLVASTVLHLRAAEPDAPFSRLIDLLCSTRLETLAAMFQKSPSPPAREVASTFFENLQKNERLAGSILVEMATRFFRFKNPSLRQVTASDDLDFTRMVDEPTALFLSIPEDEAARLEPLSACLIMQLMSALVRRATRSPGRRLPRHFAFYLDELCNAGSIPKFTKYISTVRSRGIAFILAVQDFGQLRATYGENGQGTILANCATHIVFPGCGLQETRYYSEKLGKATVETISRSSQGTGDWLDLNPHTWTHGETRRELMTPDELRTMPEGKLLVLVSKLHPLLVDNTPYYQDPDLLAEVSRPFARPAPRVTVTPVPPTSPPSRGLPTPKAAPPGQQRGPTPQQPRPPHKQASPPNQDDAEFFSPD